MIRRLEPSDVELLKELRLAALAESPSAFASTHEREAAYTDDEWRFLLRPEGHPAFVWEDDRGAQGMVIAVQDEEEPDVVHLFAMWVRPAARGTGIADSLIARVVEWAHEREAHSVRLHVTAGNDRAERVYVRHGFERTGRTTRRERNGMIEHELQLALSPKVISAADPCDPVVIE